MKIPQYWQDLTERAARTFIQGYLGAWTLASIKTPGDTYTQLFTITNLQAGLVMVAYSVAMSLGVKNIGDKNSASILTASLTRTKPIKQKKDK